MDNTNNLFSNTRALGTACMLAASLCFSTGGLLMKLIPWNPLAINGARNLIACMVIGLYILVTHHKIKFNFTVLVGAISMAGVTTLYAIANKLTTAGNTIILQYTAPIWIVILMFLFFGQKPDRTSLISILIVFVGILCFFFEGLSTGKWLGDLLALLSGIFYAGVFMLNSFEKGDALSSVFFGQLACGVFLSPLVLRETIFTPSVLLSVFLLGAVQVGLAYVFFTTDNRYQVHGSGHRLHHQCAGADPQSGASRDLLWRAARQVVAGRRGDRNLRDSVLQPGVHLFGAQACTGVTGLRQARLW